MLEREFPTAGTYRGTIICPVGKASGIAAAGWVSIRAAGGAVFDDTVQGGVWFQTSADTDQGPPGAGPPWKTQLRSGRRGWAQLPDGTEYLEYVVRTNGPGALCVELAAK